MAEAAQGTQQEFWRPPSPAMGEEVAQAESVPALAEVCPQCNSEFLLAARFCHTCGVKRPVAMTTPERVDTGAVSDVWKGFTRQIQEGWNWLGLNRIKFPELGKMHAPGWLHYLHFHEIRTRIGLSTGSLVAFVLGLVCVAGSLLVGLLTVKTMADWEAIQAYRIEWLLAATAAFVAGILLKKSDGGEQD